MMYAFLNKKTPVAGVLSVILLSATTIGSCKKNASSGSSNSYPKTVSIEYRISSVTGGISKISSGSYTNATGGNASLNDEPIPFSRKFSRIVNRGDDIGLSALHNISANSTTFSLKLDILVDGRIIKTETFIGAASTIGAIVYLFP
jgi:hypothetical protein